jgi:hypothetical protein
VRALVALLEILQIMMTGGERGHDLARNHWLRSRHVRTWSMVSQSMLACLVEAHGTATAQNQPQLLKDFLSITEIAGLTEAITFPL